jgi:hypothetical protein
LKKKKKKTHPGGVAQGVDPEFRHQYHLKKKKRKKLVFIVNVYILHAQPQDLLKN